MTHLGERMGTQMDYTMLVERKRVGGGGGGGWGGGPGGGGGGVGVRRCHTPNSLF